MQRCGIHGPDVPGRPWNLHLWSVIRSKWIFKCIQILKPPHRSIIATHDSKIITHPFLHVFTLQYITHWNKSFPICLKKTKELTSSTRRGLQSVTASLSCRFIKHCLLKHSIWEAPWSPKRNKLSIQINAARCWMVTTNSKSSRRLEHAWNEQIGSIQNTGH